MIRCGLIVASVGAILSACGPTSATNEAVIDRLTVLEARLKEVESQLSATRDTLADQGGRISTLEFQVPNIASKYEAAEFDPGVKGGYGRIDTAAGTFLVSIEDVRPYLDGVRVRARIGNIQSSTYNGFSVTANYARRQPIYPTFDDNETFENRNKRIAEWEDDIRAQQKTLKHITVKLTDVLRPGRWNDVTINLPAIKPSEFGYLGILMSVDTVSLTVPASSK